MRSASESSAEAVTSPAPCATVCTPLATERAPLASASRLTSAARSAPARANALLVRATPTRPAQRQLHPIGCRLTRSSPRGHFPPSEDAYSPTGAVARDNVRPTLAGFLLACGLP